MKRGLIIYSILRDLFSIQITVNISTFQKGSCLKAEHKKTFFSQHSDIIEKHFKILNTRYCIFLLKRNNLRRVWRSSPAEASASVWCLSFLDYISMVATSYFIIARATLTPTPHSLLFISCRYAGQTEGETVIESAAWFTTVWEAVKRSCVHPCVFLCIGLSLSQGGRNCTRKWKYHLQFKHVMITPNWCVYVCILCCDSYMPDNEITPRWTPAAVGAPWPEPRPSCP